MHFRPDRFLHLNERICRLPVYRFKRISLACEIPVQLVELVLAEAADQWTIVPSTRSSLRTFPLPLWDSNFMPLNQVIAKSAC